VIGHATTPGSEAATRLLMEQVGQTVRAALRRKSGLTLADDDARAENLDALDVYQDALIRVWERIGDRSAGSGDVCDLRSFATAVANNLWSDYLRQRHPRRASLKNRLRYFLSHAPEYALWEGPDRTLSCGRRAWRHGKTEVVQARIETLRDDPSWVPPQAKPVERYSVADWNRYVSAALTRAGGPVSFEELVSLTAKVLEVREDRVESIDARGENDRVLDELVDPGRRTPDGDVELRGSIVRLWTAIKALRADYRCAYLLNIPGPGKSRGDIEVFVDLGVTRVAEIGAVLALSDRQYAMAWDALPLSSADRADIPVLTTAEDKFCLLWKYLPLGDALIARLLGIQQQQVINRRVLALRELARALDHMG
jgi:DNA-directed RNA polymerase specialized sigma24 family protein